MNEHEQAGEHGDGYVGALTVAVAGREYAVEATMRGHFEPLDGRYHWYGRLSADDALSTEVGTGRVPAEIRTPFGSAACQLGDVDPWGRYRVTGISTPPFPVARTLEDIEPTTRT